MAGGDTFGDLRKLADWFSTSPQRSSLHIERITRRLGPTAVPLLGRELRSPDVRRREAARDGLALVATSARERVIAELRSVLEHAVIDEVKVCALGLLSELGERGEAQFDDPAAIQRRSALALATQLESAADVASAADLMIRQLDDNDIAQMIEVLAEAAPDAAQRLSAELAGRLDLDVDLRDRIATIPMTPSAPSRAARARPTHVAVLVDASARLVVVASRKHCGERRWRRWAVLIGPSGQIEDCLHEEADADLAPLIASLCADGYRVASSELDHARTVVGSAARVSAAQPHALSSAYYVGRDLLDLGDAHLGARRDRSSVALARAVDLIADGEYVRAQQILDRAAFADSPDHAAAVAACALATGRPADAVAPLERAIAAEPLWPLHYWNLAVALRTVGDIAGSYHALRRFISTSARPTALHGDPEQPARIVLAQRMLTELERAARLTGTPLRRRRARRS